MTFEEYDALARAIADDSFGSEVYGSHTTHGIPRCSYLEFWMGKHSVLDKNYDFMDSLL